MLGTLSYEKNDERINAEEVQYWKRMFRSNLKIGVEIETNLDTSINRSDATIELVRSLKPTNNFGNFGSHGVLTIKGDGSLENGIELCTIGRRLSFLDLYLQYRSITSHIFRFSPIMNQRAGLHNHVLLDYGVNYNSLEKFVPGVILKNFIQLLRRHLPELVWLTSTVKHTSSITRMKNFCDGTNLTRYTPLTRTIYEYKNKINSESRYTFINLNPLVATGDEITKFHFELRFPDGSLYPAQIASQNILYASMLIKAIELSEHGIINCGNSDLWEETKTLFAAIRTDHNGDRLSYPITETQQERIKERCKSMLLEFKSQINSFDTHSYGILSMLADKPISLMRREMDDKEINDYFHAIINNMYVHEIGDCDKISEIINLNKCTGAYSEDNWYTKISAMLEMSVSDIKNKMFKMSQVKQFYFDKELGTMLFK